MLSSIVATRPAGRCFSNGGDRDTRPLGAVALRAARVRASDAWTNGTPGRGRHTWRPCAAGERRSEYDNPVGRRGESRAHRQFLFFLFALFSFAFFFFFH